MASKRGQRRRRAKGRPPMLTGQKLNEALRLQKADQALSEETGRVLALQRLEKAFPSLLEDPYHANAEQVLAELDRLEAEDGEGQEDQEATEALEAP